MEVKDEVSSIRDEQSVVTVESLLCDGIELGKEGRDVDYDS